MIAHRRIAAALTAAAMLLVLAGCMVLPGRFTSDLALRKDGTFTFHYKGEIILAALAQGAKGAKMEEATAEPFEQQPCTDPTTDETHDCSAAEIAQQRAKWNDEQKERKAAKAEENAQNRKMMQSMMGGIDPDDPKAAEAFAQRLARQQGFTSVVSKGGGKFEVDYSISGRLDHDFTFPTIERLPMVMPFVTAIRRSDGSVRVDAPAFSTAAANPVMPGLGAMAGTLEARAKLDRRRAVLVSLSATLVVLGAVVAAVVTVVLVLRRTRRRRATRRGPALDRSCWPRSDARGQSRRTRPRGRTRQRGPRGP